MKKLIDKYKSERKIKFLTKKYKQKYAFVGIGNHSINNLYPILDYLNVDLKYIVSNGEATAKVINDNYSHIKGITDLDIALNDAEINGVFISANPYSHFKLIMRALAKDKNVFVEKPPCFTIDELKELIAAEQKSKATIVVGMQKRFAPMYTTMKENIKGASYYNYSYKVGAYPEGDATIDLFIHPLDVVTNIFGEAKIVSKQKIEKNAGVVTYLLHIKHNNGVIGNVELSTDYWWAKSHEKFYINTDKYFLESTNTDELIAINKPQSVLGIPLEKIKKPVITKTILFERNTFLPVQEHNQLKLSGYYDEIVSYLNICENISKNNNADINSMLNTYNLINELTK